MTCLVTSVYCMLLILIYVFTNSLKVQSRPLDQILGKETLGTCVN